MYQGAEGLPSAPVAFIFVFPICPRHPGMGTPVPWEVHQAADLLLCAHGTLTPPRFSRGCPHCVIPGLAGAVTGQKYHCILSHILAAAGCRPGICSWFFSLPADCSVNIKNACCSDRSWRTPAKAPWEIVQNVPDEMHIQFSRCQSSSSCCSEVSLIRSGLSS